MHAVLVLGHARDHLGTLHERVLRLDVARLIQRAHAQNGLKRLRHDAPPDKGAVLAHVPLAARHAVRAQPELVRLVAARHADAVGVVLAVAVRVRYRKLPDDLFELIQGRRHLKPQVVQPVLADEERLVRHLRVARRYGVNLAVLCVAPPRFLRTHLEDFLPVLLDQVVQREDAAAVGEVVEVSRRVGPPDLHHVRVIAGSQDHLALLPIIARRAPVDLDVAFDRLLQQGQNGVVRIALAQLAGDDVQGRPIGIRLCQRGGHAQGKARQQRQRQNRCQILFHLVLSFLSPGNDSSARRGPAFRPPCLPAASDRGGYTEILDASFPLDSKPVSS